MAGGQESIGQPPPRTLGTRLGLRSEADAVGLLDGAWAGQESQPSSSAIDSFFAMVADDAPAEE
jgi:hypothetical protein